MIEHQHNAHIKATSVAFVNRAAIIAVAIIANPANIIGEAVSTSRIVWSGIFLPCEMRATPTTTVYGANGLEGYVSSYNGVNHYNGAFTMVGMSQTGGGQRSDGSEVLASGGLYQCRITLEAEL